MATIVGDVTGQQQRHHPQNIPHLVEKIKGFPLNEKSFRNTATYQKPGGGVPSTPPCTTVGAVTLCVRPRLNNQNGKLVIINGELVILK